jgi:hypothetical protein
MCSGTRGVLQTEHLTERAASAVVVIPRALYLAPGVATQQTDAPSLCLSVRQGFLDLLAGVPWPPVRQITLLEKIATIGWLSNDN